MILYKVVDTITSRSYGIIIILAHVECYSVVVVVVVALSTCHVPVSVPDLCSASLSDGSMRECRECQLKSKELPYFVYVLVLCWASK